MRRYRNNNLKYSIENWSAFNAGSHFATGQGTWNFPQAALCWTWKVPIQFRTRGLSQTSRRAFYPKIHLILHFLPHVRYSFYLEPILMFVSTVCLYKQVLLKVEASLLIWKQAVFTQDNLLRILFTMLCIWCDEVLEHFIFRLSKESALGITPSFPWSAPHVSKL